MQKNRSPALRAAALAGLLGSGCGNGSSARSEAQGGSASIAAGAGGSAAAANGAGGTSAASGAGGSIDTSAPLSETSLAVAAGPGLRIPSTAHGLNYWMWVPAWGDPVAGTESMIAPLGIGLLRFGGHNNDNNTPAPFNEAEIDAGVAYARAIGAEPLLQVPLLADVAGARPTAQTAADIVAYSNATAGHGLKYFSIGNEPDLYPDQESGLQAYTPATYCAAVEAYVPAMKAVDPTIQIVGPELSWKYQAPDNDWLTPILADCGQLLDVVAVHRYRLDPAQTTIERASADAAAFRSEIAALRSKLASAGLAERPLAITEANITWTSDGSVLDASPGTFAAGLWLADAFGVALEQGLWTFAYWSVVEGVPLGLLSEQKQKRAAYHALGLLADTYGSSASAPAAGAQARAVASSSPGVHGYARRNAIDDTTLMHVVNWTRDRQRLSIGGEGIGGEGATGTSFEVPPFSLSRFELPDGAAARGWTYSEAELRANAAPRALP